MCRATKPSSDLREAPACVLVPPRPAFPEVSVTVAFYDFVFQASSSQQPQRRVWGSIHLAPAYTRAPISQQGVHIGGICFFSSRCEDGSPHWGIRYARDAPLIGASSGRDRPFGAPLRTAERQTSNESRDATRDATRSTWREGTRGRRSRPVSGYYKKKNEKVTIDFFPTTPRRHVLGG